jgi:thioredoxin 2
MIVTCEHCGKKNRVPAAAQGYPRCGNCHRPLPWIVDANDDNFAEVVERAGIPVLVDLWAVWCGPCRMVSPVLEQLAREYAGKIKLVKIDVDATPKLSQRFQVQAVPTLMVLSGGEVIARQAGAAPAPVLREWLEQALAADTDRASDATAGQR